MNIEDEFDLILSASERQSPLWQKVVAFLENQLKIARAKNDNAALTEQETAAIRGRIHALKAMIALGDRPLPTE